MVLPPLPHADLTALITPQTAAVIYAASASRKDGAKRTSDARAVDRDGLVACAKLCVEQKVRALQRADPSAPS